MKKVSVSLDIRALDLNCDIIFSSFITYLILFKDSNDRTGSFFVKNTFLFSKTFSLSTIQLFLLFILTRIFPILNIYDRKKSLCLHKENNSIINMCEGKR